MRGFTEGEEARTHRVRVCWVVLVLQEKLCTFVVSVQARVVERGVVVNA